MARRIGTDRKRAEAERLLRSVLDTLFDPVFILAAVRDGSGAVVDIIAGIDFPWPVARTILQHHERLDGSGYPFGLKGDEIGLGARIIMVADVLEAMTSPRAYRPAASIADALGEIERESGTQYDPGVVAACLQLYSGMKRRHFDGDPGYWFPTAAAAAF